MNTDETSDDGDSGDNGDSGDTGDTGDTGDSNGDGGNEDCGGIDIPEGYEDLIAGGQGCDYIECLFDELGVDSPEEFEEKYGDLEGDPSPELIGEFTAAIQACASLITPPT